MTTTTVWVTNQWRTRGIERALTETPLSNRMVRVKSLQGYPEGRYVDRRWCHTSREDAVVHAVDLRDTVIADFQGQIAELRALTFEVEDENADPVCDCESRKCNAPGCKGHCGCEACRDAYADYQSMQTG